MPTGSVSFESLQRRLLLQQFLRQLAGTLSTSDQEEKLLRAAVRATGEFFGADRACLAVLEPGAERAELLADTAQGPDWNLDLLTHFLRGQPLLVHPNVLLAAVRRRGRSWAALGLARTSRPFDRRSLRELAPVAELLSQTLARIDQQRILDVRARVDRKIMEQLRPRDLFYQLLHGLRSLTRYDHSSALLVHPQDAPDLELAAEQIAAVKGKSLSIGRRFPLTEPLREQLRRGGVLGFNREGETWRAWDQRPVSAIAELLDYNRRTVDGPIPALPREASIVCAPIATREGVIGVLKLAGLRPGSLGDYEAQVLAHFCMPASVGIQYLLRTESLETKMVAAERKNAMANVARVVSHDISNALGAALPLVQELRANAQEGQLDAAQAAGDLEQIEHSIQFSRRLFQNMLSVARPGAGKVGSGNIRRAIETAMALLRRNLERGKIEVTLTIADKLPSVRGGHDDLTKLILNLASNAREAMPEGGRLVVRAQPCADGVELEIADTGCGIPAESLARVGELFYTTKESGNGLGLSICRSIVDDVGGNLTIHSEPGRGTTVRVILPHDGPARRAAP